MAATELAVRLVEALVWPVIAVVALLVLRNPISTLLTRDSPLALKFGPFEMKWERVAAETERAASAERAGLGGGPARSQLAEELAPAVVQTPLVAIQEAYKLLENQLRETVRPAEGVELFSMGPVRLARLAAEQGRISPDVVQTVQGLMVMHNMAVHARGPAVTSERAREYLTLVDAALHALRTGPDRDAAPGPG